MSKKVSSIGGVRIKSLFAALMFIVSFFGIGILVVSLSVKRNYSKIVNSKDDYSECSVAIMSLQMASNSLTSSSRLFVESGNTFYLKDYFSQIDGLRSREEAMHLLEKYCSDENIQNKINCAYVESGNLQLREFYAMYLVYDVYKDIIPIADVPARLLETALLPDDLELSDMQKLSLARDLLYAPEYTDAQVLIANDLQESILDLASLNVATQTKYQSRIVLLFVYLIFFVGGLFASAIVTYVCLYRLVYIPLKKFVNGVGNGLKVVPDGAYEIQYLEDSYNILCDKNNLTNTMLKHKAEHDSLTGLINREGFDQIKEVLNSSETYAAYLLVDVDLFKTVNDRYGHATGDDVLRKVSNLLMEQFRATDYVARIGGDEFAVIMTEFETNENETKKIISNKVKRLNDLLANPDDGLPAVSLSVGAAISSGGFDFSMEEKADKALYEVKRGGRCGCAFGK